MVSVTSEVSANASFQNAAARSARPDSEPSAGNDSFAALVDSNTAASNNDNRTQDTRARPAPLRRCASRVRQPLARQCCRIGQAPTRPRATIRMIATPRPTHAATRHATTATVDAKADTDTKTDTDTKAATTRRAKSKTDAPKSDGAKSDETTQALPATLPRSTDQTETAQDGTAVVTADAIAVAIPAAAAPAATASATPSNRQGDRAACDRSRGDRSLRFARRRDGAGRSRR